MKWCPICKIDFEDYVEKCSDCGEMLISEDVYEQQGLHKDFKLYPDGLNLVTVYESTLESDVLHVSTLLEENGIFSEVKNNGIGSYLQIYSGVNYLGTSICVKEEDAEAARAIIENLWGESASEMKLDETYDDFTFEDEEPDMAAYRDKYNKSLNLKRNILKLFLLLILGTSLIVTILSISN